MATSIYTLPIDILCDRILPYTYCSQPQDLRADILSYHKTTENVKNLYSFRYPPSMMTEEYDDDEGDMAWLSNDITRFLNNDKATMFGYVDFYKLVFQRLYMNRNKDLKMVSIPPIAGGINFQDVKVSIGLLLPAERLNLERFLMRVAWSRGPVGD